MARAKHNQRRSATGVAWLSAVIAVLLLTPVAASGQAGMVEVDAATYEKRTIFSSHPQQCGDGSKNCRLSEWVGTWFMPDGRLMVAFNLVTGPTAPAFGRAFMPERLLNQFRLDDGRAFTHKYPAPAGYYYFDKGYDFYGLSGECPPSPQIPTTQRCSLVVYLSSTDEGEIWTPWRTEAIRGLGMTAHTPQADIALPDGALIRRVNGDDLQHLAGIPYTAMLQVLKPVRGVYPEKWPALGRRGQLAVSDHEVCKYQVSRIRRLRDGRYLALGQAWRYAGPGGKGGRCVPKKQGTDMLLVAASAAAVERGDWKRGMPDLPASVLVPNEWDAAQLENGDLLALFRTSVSVSSGTQIRKQAILRARPVSECPDPKASGCWVLDQATLGNPGNFPHSGHPELLATREGVILQFATTGNYYTTDGGATWLPLTGTAPSDYYPRAIQNPATGDIFLFGHVGHDDPYGGKSTEGGGNYSGINQSITMQKFRLKIVRPSDK